MYVRGWAKQENQSMIESVTFDAKDHSARSEEEREGRWSWEEWTSEEREWWSWIKKIQDLWWCHFWWSDVVGSFVGKIVIGIKNGKKRRKKRIKKRRKKRQTTQRSVTERRSHRNTRLDQKRRRAKSYINMATWHVTSGQLNTSLTAKSIRTCLIGPRSLLETREVWSIGLFKKKEKQQEWILFSIVETLVKVDTSLSHIRPNASNPVRHHSEQSLRFSKNDLAIVGRGTLTNDIHQRTPHKKPTSLLRRGVKFAKVGQILAMSCTTLASQRCVYVCRRRWATNVSKLLFR